MDLGSLALASGQAATVDIPVALAPLELGGNEYVADPPNPRVLVDISRTVAGYALRLRFQTSFIGPCVRCLGDARIGLTLDVREVDQGADADSDVDLDCPYLSGDLLDVSRWAGDSVALAFPAQPLCEEGCGGICPTCGERIAAGEEPHAHASQGDPRMSALGEIEFE